MNKTTFAAAALVGLLASPYTFADNSASTYSDGTAVIGSAAARVGLTDADGFVQVLATELKNSGTPKDLIVGLSFETSLFTETVVRSKGGDKSSAEADAEIEMYVTVDGEMAAPGIVTFDKRRQELWAKLSGIQTCTDANGDNIVNYDECELTEEEIGLILETKEAHAFNFLAYDIGSGGHTIEAFARLSQNGSVVGDGSANANATLGKGTLSVWEVHGSTSTK